MKMLLRAARLPFLPIALAPLALLAPVFLAGEALFWGTPLLQFIPWWASSWETLLSGGLPLWNPSLGMGAPLLANYQSALLYPPHWSYLLLYALGGVPAMAYGQAFLAALHLAWAGLGAALLARRIGLGSLAAAVSGLSFGLSGYLVSRAGFLSINAAAAWLPWVILCLTPAHPGRGLARRGFLGLVVCLGMQLLAGHAQVTWYTLLLAGVWAGFWAWSRVDDAGANAQVVSWAPLRRVALAWFQLALAGGLAVCLAAAQLFPTAEYLAQSQRSAAVDYDFAMNYSFWPWRLLTLLAPDMFGNPATGDYWGYANYWEDAVYIGLLPFLLAVSALLGAFARGLRARLRKHRAFETQPLAMQPRFAGFLFCLFALALLLALGDHTRVYPWLYKHVPTFDMFQAPARYMIWAEFALALLAGLGAQRWRRPEKRALYWTRLGAAGAFAVSLGAGLAWYTMGDISLSFIRAMALAGMWGLGAGLLSLAAPPQEGQAASQPGQAAVSQGRFALVWQWGVACFVAADLVFAGWGLNPGVGLDVYRAAPTAGELRALLAGRRLYLPAVYEETVKYKRFLRFDTFDPGEDWLGMRAWMLPNANLLDGIPSANNFDPLLPGRYADWVAYLPQAEWRAWYRMLDLMNVGALAVPGAGNPYGVRFLPLEGGSRARWTPCARFVQDGQDAWGQITSEQLDFNRWVILEANASEPAARCETPAGLLESAQAQIVAETAARLVVRVSAPASGWLVLSDTWYPGWRAWVDGRATPVLRADYLFRAVPLEAGEHQVVFAYQPLSFWLGLALSLATCFALFLFWRKPARPV
ncbi:MAG: YfhO family protein [Anaerolineales bacterium]|nr:YfhO family protein [Anaerolineales bacterium]